LRKFVFISVGSADDSGNAQQLFLIAGLLQSDERHFEGQISPQELFTTVAGIGEALAHRIHVELDIETLEELELAAHDGRLERVSGIGRRRS